MDREALRKLWDGRRRLRPPRLLERRRRPTQMYRAWWTRSELVSDCLRVGPTSFWSSALVNAVVLLWQLFQKGPRNGLRQLHLLRQSSTGAGKLPRSLAAPFGRSVPKRLVTLPPAPPLTPSRPPWSRRPAKPHGVCKKCATPMHHHSLVSSAGRTLILSCWSSFLQEVVAVLTLSCASFLVTLFVRATFLFSEVFPHEILHLLSSRVFLPPPHLILHVLHVLHRVLPHRPRRRMDSCLPRNTLALARPANIDTNLQSSFGVPGTNSNLFPMFVSLDSTTCMKSSLTQLLHPPPRASHGSLPLSSCDLAPPTLGVERGGVGGGIFALTSCLFSGAFIAGTKQLEHMRRFFC